MRKSVKLQLEQSTTRQALNALLAKDELTDEERSELDTLTKRMGEIETELRAALTADEADETRAREQFGEVQRGAAETPEARELRRLIDGANVGMIFSAAIEHRASIEGETGELQTELGLGANQVPLDLIETRAVTPAPGDTQANQQPIVMPVFAGGDAAFLSVAQPRVPVGEAVFPVLTSRPTVGGPHRDSTPVAETTGAFTADVLSPARLQASFFWKRTDAAKFGGMSDALRMALNSGLSEAMDQEVVDQIVADVARTDAGAVDTFATYRSKLVYGRLDGRFASGEGDIRILTGAATVSHMASLYRGNNADDSALDSIRRISGGVRVSALVAAVAGNKQDAIVRRGTRPDAVAPIWEGVTLIPDEITLASKGEIQVTAVMLAAFKVTRTDGFARMETQHAA